MQELLIEDDYCELPEEAHHKWLQLEKIAKSRLLVQMGRNEALNDRLMLHYMNVIKTLANSFGVEDIAISSEPTAISFGKFELAIARAQAKIWAESVATYPFGRAVISPTTKSVILDLTSEIESQINSLELNENRRKALHSKLEDFRREINQPKTRIASALSSLTQISTVVAMTTTTFAQLPTAYTTIQNLLGAEQLTISSPEILLLESEKQLLLSQLPLPKQIELQKPENPS